ncbi:MAG: hypothetical protein KJZ86_04835 [Caldilineaceae bacterium]|nr:hypothetical protein [Caldilineaceae bacterium]
MAHRFGQPPRGLSITLLVLMLVSVLFATARAAPPSQADEAEWLLMFYVDADDDTLELDMLIDLQEAELIGSTDQVHIVAQVDRFKGSFDGMGDFTGAKRFYITQDADVNVIGSEVVQELGEVNMADSKTLLDFITWAVANYPARKTMLVLSDHGIGWPGGFGDPDPDVQGAHNIFLREAFGHDNLWLMEIDDTLAKARKATGIEQFDIVGFDACLMAQLEIFTALAPHARYSVASEETEPGVGWAYTAFLAELVQNPEMEGADLSQAIVANYIDQDMRLRIDPNFTGGLEPEVVAQQLFHDATLTAVDLSQIGALNRALDELTVALSAIDQKAVAQARSYAQAYESVFGEEWPSPYIDLGSFLGNVTTQNKDAGLKKAADGVKAALGKAVIAERHGAGRPGSSGIAIYFPVPSMHAFQDNWGYTQVAARFAAESQWDEFLAFHSNGGIPPSFSRPKPGLPEQVIQQFGELIAPEDVELLFQAIEELRAEELDAETIAAILTDDLGIPQEVVDFLTAAGALGEQPPGAPASSQAKPIRVSPIALSAEVAEPGAPVNIQSEISGDQVGFVYSFIGRFLPNENVLIIEDRDYIFADENETVGGVTYPVWPEGGFVVDFDWEPTVYAISDGETSLRVLFQPESYGETPTYSVEAIYHFANGGPDRYARLFFREGELLQILGFTGAATNGVGAPWEIRPTPGDSVTILEQSINLDPEATDDSYTREIGDLTFGESRFFIEETPAPSGNYVVGIIAEDLAGNTYEQYEGLFVVNEEAAVEDGVLPYVNDELAFALLYPEEWFSDESEEGVVSFVSPDETSVVTILQTSYPDAASAQGANEQALLDAVEGLGTDSDLADLEFVEPADYVLGAFDARTVDFSATLDGIPLLGSVAAATPQSGMTFVVLTMAQDDVYEDALPLFDALFFSFDVLISGIERGEAGAPLPEIGGLLFVDDFSDPTSGLYDDAEAQAWGRGYYDAKTERYIYALAPAPGAIYDYYADVALPDSFALQVSTSYTGTDNNAYGLIFQMVDEESFYLFRVSGDGYFLVEKASAEGVVPLIDWTIADNIATGEGGENVLTVVAQAGDYAVYINDAQVGHFSDEEYSGGSFGLVADAYDLETPASFFYDDLIVAELAE